MKAFAYLPIALLVAAVATAEDKPPAPKLPLGKDTTFVTGPLDKHGYIDYEAALNAELSKGITRDNNAHALLVQVFGPAPEGGDGMPLDYFKWLDIAVPPKDGEYFIGMTAYVRDKLGLSGERLEAFFETQGRVMQRPWVTKDCPPMAEWLKANEKPLALATEAMKRPEYFNPLVSRRKEGDGSNLIGTLLPTVQKCRELASAFTARAMLRLKEGMLDDAWADLMTVHRLGRLVSRGGTLIESLVGIAIGQIASNSTLGYLEHPDLTSKRALACLKDLRGLPPLSPLADKIGMCERMMGLDAIQNIRRAGGAGGLDNLFAGENFVIVEEKKAFETVDWTTVMQTLNKGYDRLETALRLKDRAARLKEFEKIEEAYKEIKKEFADSEKAKKFMKENGKDGKALGKALGDVLMGMLSPALQKVQQAYDRGTQVSANLQVAFALAAYHKDTGDYPAKLADLAPKYLANVPNDLFANKALIYKPNEKGYLLYSVGVNGKDEGGNTYGSENPGDDLPVKMPLPELKKN